MQVLSPQETVRCRQLACVVEETVAMIQRLLTAKRSRATATIKLLSAIAWHDRHRLWRLLQLHAHHVHILLHLHILLHGRWHLHVRHDRCRRLIHLHARRPIHHLHRIELAIRKLALHFDGLGTLAVVLRLHFGDLGHFLVVFCTIGAGNGTVPQKVLNETPTNGSTVVLEARVPDWRAMVYKIPSNVVVEWFP